MIFHNFIVSFIRSVPCLIFNFISLLSNDKVNKNYQIKLLIMQIFSFKEIINDDDMFVVFNIFKSKTFTSCREKNRQYKNVLWELMNFIHFEPDSKIIKFKENYFIFLKLLLQHKNCSDLIKAYLFSNSKQFIELRNYYLFSLSIHCFMFCNKIDS